MRIRYCFLGGVLKKIHALPHAALPALVLRYSMASVVEAWLLKLRKMRPETAEECAKKNAKLQMVTMELLETESNYVGIISAVPLWGWVVYVSMYDVCIIVM